MAKLEPEEIKAVIAEHFRQSDVDAVENGEEERTSTLRIEHGGGIPSRPTNSPNLPSRRCSRRPINK